MDPLEQITAFAEKHSDAKDRFTAIALGQGQHAKAEAAVR
jgi:hypothetical protein